MLDAKDILENYPKLKVKGKDGKLFEMCGDLLFLDINGRIERITKCNITESKLKRRKWIELEILSSVLVDKGIKVEDQKL